MNKHCGLRREKVTRSTGRCANEVSALLRLLQRKEGESPASPAGQRCPQSRLASRQTSGQQCARPTGQGDVSKSGRVRGGPQKILPTTDGYKNTSKNYQNLLLLESEN